MRSGNIFAINHSRAAGYLDAAGWRAAFFFDKLHYVYIPNRNHTVINKANFIYALKYKVTSTPSIPTKLVISQRNYCGDFYNECSLRRKYV